MHVVILYMFVVYFRLRQWWVLSSKGQEVYGGGEGVVVASAQKYLPAMWGENRPINHPRRGIYCCWNKIHIFKCSVSYTYCIHIICCVPGILVESKKSPRDLPRNIDNMYNTTTPIPYPSKPWLFKRICKFGGKNKFHLGLVCLSVYLRNFSIFSTTHL